MKLTACVCVRANLWSPLRKSNMPGSLKPDVTSPMLRSASWRRRTEALVVTSLATFLCGMLIWPLGTRGFDSECRVSITLNSTPQDHQLFHQRLRSVLNQQLGDARVQRAVDLALESQPVSNSALRTSNIDWIREKISVGLRQQNPDQYQLRLLFTGNGRPEELRLIELLSAEVVRAMRQRSTDALPIASIADRDQRFEQMEWLLTSIEDALSVAHRQASELAQPTPTLEMELQESESMFRNVGHIREVQPTAERLCQTIDGIDVATLRQLMKEVKGDSPTTQPAAVAATDAQTNRAAAITGIEAASARQYPVGAIPGTLQIICFGLLALGVGSVVAVNVQPFAEHGFENAQQIAESLGVPVIGKLASHGEHSEAADARDASGQSLPIANRLTLMGGTLVFSILLIAVGFSLIDPEIREGFIQNPFHGFARIVWIFTGR